jgi:Arc/MetJ family transcription regulator
MITNIDIDDEVVAEAMKVSGARTKREVVDRALREMVARARRPAFRDLRGIGGIDPDYDPKAPDTQGAGAGQYRVEQARPAYKTKSKAAKS